MERRGKVKRKGNNNSTASSAPPWIEFPRDVTANILRRLSPEEILDKAEKVCTTWRSVCREPSIWRVLYLKYREDLYIHGNADRVCRSAVDRRQGQLIDIGHADSVCRRAVDRSQGQLIDICIEQFGNDDLLRYISERSPHLKILSLESCGSISPGGLTAAVKILSCLEELHLFFAPMVSDLDIETIGLSCPMLNSFTFNNLRTVSMFYNSRISRFDCRFEDTDNRFALSIAKNMPNLRRLSLVGNRLGNEGLLAILDGCPNLELLDLLHCFNVNLECDLGGRCSEQVKILRHPACSTLDCDCDSDCQWDDRLYYLKGGDDDEFEDEDEDEDDDDYHN